MKLSRPGAPTEELSGTSNVRDMGIKVLFAAWLCRSRFHYAWHVEEDAYMADWIYLLRATAGSTADVIAVAPVASCPARSVAAAVPSMYRSWFVLVASASE